MLPMQSDRPRPDLPPPRPPVDRGRDLCARYATANRRSGQLLSRRRTPPRSGRSRSRDRDRVRRRAQRRDPCPTCAARRRSRQARSGASRRGRDKRRRRPAPLSPGARARRPHPRLHRGRAAAGHLRHSWTAARVLESSRLDQEPPSLVRHTQDAARWLPISIACLDQDSRETAAALADTLARLLVVCVFADAACTSSESRIE